jgi:hypothetical protein
LAQQIGAEKGATSADHDHQIGCVDISPLDWQRTQTPLGAQVRDAVPTPIVAHREQIKALSSQRMKGMRDGENLRVTVATVCNARFSPRLRSREEFL